MNLFTQPESGSLATKIARLVEERGWNQEDFARIADLSRQTVRDILQPTVERKLRNASIGKCAQALGLSVNELRTLPLERLLPRMRNPRAADGGSALKHFHDNVTQPELVGWAQRNPKRAEQLTAEEIEELIALQGAGGPLTTLGAEHVVGQIERRRKLLDRVRAIAGTEYLGLLEQLVGLMYEKVRPVDDR